MSNTRKRKLDAILHIADPLEEKGTVSHVTRQTLHRLASLYAEDDSNLTKTSRPLKKYDKYVSRQAHLIDVIEALAKQLNRKINLLDVGCGEGVAIDELLSNERLNDSLGRCTGVSMHYFANIETVMKKHGNRFEYYYGKVQDVIASQHSQYDVIVDVFGAYYYSADRMKLLALYHQALTPQGKAHVHVSMGSIVALTADQEGLSPVLKALCTDHPDTFQLHRNAHKKHDSLTITKATERYPAKKHHLLMFWETSSINEAKGHALNALRRGNAVHPSASVVIESEEKQYDLRPLKF